MRQTDRCSTPRLARAVGGLLALALVLLTDLTLGWAAPSADWKPYVPERADEVSAPLFVVLAYSVIWVALLLFVLSVWRRQRKLEVEIADLRARLGGKP